MVMRCVWVRLQATKHRELPAWVTFPDFERVEWVNAVITQIWPHAASAIVTQVRCTHDPDLEMLRVSPRDISLQLACFCAISMAGGCWKICMTLQLLLTVEPQLSQCAAGAGTAGPTNQGS